MIKKIVYVTDDGKTFESEEDCLEHEHRHLYAKANIKNDLFCFAMENKR